MKKWIKATAIAGGIATAATFSVSFAASKLFMTVAVRRNCSAAWKTLQKKFSGKAIHSENIDQKKQCAQQLRQHQTQTVTIKATDGTTLVGHWVAAKTPKRLVIALHGWHSSWDKDFGGPAELLYDDGCSVLYVEQRCHGESQGEYVGFGSVEYQDCLDWLSFLTDWQKNQLPVYLYGISMGATCVLLASGFLSPDRVHGIIADCGFISLEQVWRSYARSVLHISGRLIYQMIHRQLWEKAHYDDAKMTTDAILRGNRIPLLLIHGDADRFVPMQMSQRNYAACAGPKRLLIVPGAGHMESYWKAPSVYKQALMTFFASYEEEG